MNCAAKIRVRGGAYRAAAAAPAGAVRAGAISARAPCAVTSLRAAPASAARLARPDNGHGPRAGPGASF